MKKLLILFCIMLPFCVKAQDFERLKNQADSLRKTGKNKKAQNIYNAAINRVLDFKESISDNQWMLINVSAHANDYDLTKKADQPYICWEYGNDGPVLKEKIKTLLSQNVKCVFTYKEWLGMTGPPIYLFKDSISGGTIGIKKGEETLLVWATDKNVYFQEFSSSNVYKPLVILNDTLKNILMNHADEMIHQDLKREYWTHSEVPFYMFDFYIGQELLKRRLYDPKNLTNPEANSKTWLAKLMPMMWMEYKLYKKHAVAN